MNKVWKCLIPFGRYQAPNPKGESVSVVASRARAKHWKRQFDELTKLGYKIPVPWGHALESIPLTRVVMSSLSRETEAELARQNASYLDDMQVRDDGVWVKFEAPPGYRVEGDDLINERTHTKIRDVSAGLGNMVDGQGNFRRDVILHVALVTYPIAPSGGFTAALSSVRESSCSFTCALSSSMRESDMARDADDLDTIDEMADSEPDDETDAAEGQVDMASEEPVDGEDMDEFDAGSDAMPEDEGEIDVQDMPEMSATGDPEFMEAVQLLRQSGLDIPEGIEEKKIWAYLCAALRMGISMGCKFAKPDMQMQGEPKGVKMSSNMTGDPNVQAESPPILMSVASIKDPLVKTLVEREQKRVRKQTEDTWRRIAKLGCPAHIANREMAKANAVTLSVNGNTGTVKTPAALHIAKLVEEILKGMSGGGAEIMQKLSTATAVHPRDTGSASEGKPGTAAQVPPSEEGKKLFNAMRVAAGLEPEKG